MDLKARSKLSAASNSQKTKPQRPDGYQQLRKEMIAYRIKEALADCDTAKIAKSMNVSRATIYDWSSGRFLPGVERLGLLAHLTGVSPVWLLVGRGGKRASVGQPEGYLIPLVGNLRRSPLAFEEEWYAEIRRHSGAAQDEQLRIMAVTDESMVPTLRRGELVLYRLLKWSNDERGDNGLYVLEDAVRKPSIDGQEQLPLNRLIARRVQWGMDGTLTISCDNQAYAAEIRKWSGSTSRPIMGPIVWRGGPI